MILFNFKSRPNGAHFFGDVNVKFWILKDRLGLSKAATLSLYWGILIWNNGKIDNPNEFNHLDELVEKGIVTRYQRKGEDSPTYKVNYKKIVHCLFLTGGNKKSKKRKGGRKG